MNRQNYTPTNYYSPIYESGRAYKICQKNDGAHKTLTHNIYDSKLNRYICVIANTQYGLDKLYNNIQKIGINHVSINQIPKNTPYRLFADFDFNKSPFTTNQRRHIIDIYHKWANNICGRKINLLLDENNGNFHGRFNLKLNDNIIIYHPNAKDPEFITYTRIKYNIPPEAPLDSTFKIKSTLLRKLIIRKTIEELSAIYSIDNWNEIIDDSCGIRTPSG